MTDWLVTNAQLLNEDRQFHADLRMCNGRIERIDAQLAAQPGERVLDASGRWLPPGVPDDQVHFREPGLAHKADIEHESRACGAGGITSYSYVEMPNTKLPATNHAALEAKYVRTVGVSRANYGFFFGASNDNIEAILTLDPHAATGIKVFMGSQTGKMLADNPATLDAIVRDAPVPIITHCEDPPMILANEADARARRGEDILIEQTP